MNLNQLSARIRLLFNFQQVQVGFVFIFPQRYMTSTTNLVRKRYLDDLSKKAREFYLIQLFKLTDRTKTYRPSRNSHYQKVSSLDP